MDYLRQTPEDYRKMGGPIAGFMWLATLDLKTCILCAARDHLRYNHDLLPVGHHIAYRPIPLHDGCRCTTTPVLKTWEEMGVTNPGILKALGDWEGRMQRASANGPVAAELTFSQWLRKRGSSDQEGYLGKLRYEVWRDTPEMTLVNFVDSNGLLLPDNIYK